MLGSTATKQHPLKRSTAGPGKVGQMAGVGWNEERRKREKMGWEGCSVSSSDGAIIQTTFLALIHLSKSIWVDPERQQELTSLPLGKAPEPKTPLWDAECALLMWLHWHRGVRYDWVCIIQSWAVRVMWFTSPSKNYVHEMTDMQLACNGKIPRPSELQLNWIWFQLHSGSPMLANSAVICSKKRYSH